MNPPTLSRLSDPADPRFAALLALYTEAFPPEERKPVAHLHRMLQQPGYQFFVAERGDAVLGLAILRCAETAEIALLEYLAVQPASRGNGLGRLLLQHVLLAADITRRPLLIEAESDLVPSPDQAIRCRRKQFYRAAGAREITGLRYRMPAVAAVLPPPMELLLFARPMPMALPKTRLQRWLTALYDEVYGQPAHDPRLAEMLGDLPEAIPLA